jgi:hypothetical protein
MAISGVASVQASDAADQISEALAEDRAEARDSERFRSRAAIIIAILAMLLAIASLGGENAAKQAMDANIRASDSYAFYQAKNIRQTANQIAADELEATLALHSAGLDPAVRAQIQGRVQNYRDTVARYESEPDPGDPSNPLRGEGKKELLARAQHWEAERDQALQQDPNFDYSTALLQIAIVLGSVAIVSISRIILVLSLILGTIGALLMLNGYYLLVDLPFG